LTAHPPHTLLSSQVRHTLDQYQTAQPDGKVRAIARHCPTRFGILHFICQDLHRDKEAIKAMVVNDDGDAAWSEVSKNCEHGDTFKEYALGVAPRTRGARAFHWRDMDLAIKVGQPIINCIHELEADKPRLSWMLPAYVALIDAVKAFDADTAVMELASAYGDTVTLESVVKARMDLQYNKAWAAAYLVDPIFAAMRGTGWYLRAGRERVLTAAKMQDALECLKELAGPGNQDAVAAEFTRLTLAPLPFAMADALPTLTRRTRGEDERDRVVGVQLRIGFWEMHEELFPHISKVAVRLLSFHVTACASERNWSTWGGLADKATNRRSLARTEKLVAIMENSGDTRLSLASADDAMLRLLSEAADEDAA
jgi:hypothetical protein